MADMQELDKAVGIRNLPFRLILAFDDPLFERGFLDHYTNKYYRFAQISIGIGFILILGDFLVDFFAYPDVKANTNRLLLTLPLMAAGIWYSFTQHGKRNWQMGMATFVVCVAACLFWVLILIDRQGGTGLSSWVGILNFTFVEFYGFLILGVQFRYSLVSGALILLAFLTAMWFGFGVNVKDVAYWSYHVVTLFILAAGIGWWREYVIRSDFSLRSSLDQERGRSQSLLESILPSSVLRRMRSGERVIADLYPDVSVIFLDIRGFTALASKIEPTHLVGILDSIFSAFDRICDEFGVEKIKTIGDSYMAVAGMHSHGSNHAEKALLAARSMVLHFNKVLENADLPIGIRAGIHSGSVVGGVLGTKKPHFDIWGDVVNVASRMESTGKEGMIQVSEETWHRVQQNFQFLERGEVDVKGKGVVRTYLHDPRAEISSGIHSSAPPILQP